MKKDSFKLILILIVSVLIITLFSTSLLAIKTFNIQETDKISLSPESVDPDGDDVIYYYSNPLNDDGEWETNYDDAGEYLVDITASDGINKTIETIKIIVDNKNQAPVFSKKEFTFQETDLINIKNFIVDPDEDILEFVFEEPFNELGEWQTSYDDSGRYVIDVVVNDGEFTEEDRIEIVVEETNQPPTIEDSFHDDKEAIKIYENEVLDFEVDAEDYDGDEITFLWILDNETISEKDDGEIYFDYDSSGEHELSVTVSDGELKTVQKWTIEVEHVNREPDVEDLKVELFETETLKLELPTVDQDGDNLSYSFDSLLDENDEWETNYDNAGIYTIEVIANDGEYDSEFEITVNVKDVDRAPELNFPERLEVSEGQELLWELDAVDLDGDELTFEFSGFSYDVIFNNETDLIYWDVPYNYIIRNSNLFYDFLNSIRVEKYLIGKEESQIDVTVCGKDLCSTESVELIVYNTNRAPEIVELYNQSITETEYLDIFVNAVDPDGDIIKYSFTEPLSKKEGDWETGYEDAGEQIIYVTASDGDLTDTKAITVNVENVNRAPSITTKNDELKVNEGQEFMFSLDISDPDNDNLTLTLENIPEGASFSDNTFLWEPSFDIVVNNSNSFWDKIWSYSNILNRKFSDNSETLWLDFTVSDEEFEIVHPIKLEIKNVNRLPVIKTVYPDELLVNAISNDESIEFSVEADDLDGDELEYEWTFSGADIFNSVEGSDSITRKFTSTGEKSVKVTVSDGRNSVEHEWLVQVGSSSSSTVSNSSTTQEVTYKVYTVEDWK